MTAKIPARVEPVKGAKGNRITHRIAIETVEDVDDFVARWLKTAYDADE